MKRKEWREESGERDRDQIIERERGAEREGVENTDSRGEILRRAWSDKW